MKQNLRSLYVSAHGDFGSQFSGMPVTGNGVLKGKDAQNPEVGVVNQLWCFTEAKGLEGILKMMQQV